VGETVLLQCSRRDSEKELVNRKVVLNESASLVRRRERSYMLGKRKKECGEVSWWIWDRIRANQKRVSYKGGACASCRKPKEKNARQGGRDRLLRHTEDEGDGAPQTLDLEFSLKRGFRHFKSKLGEEKTHRKVR